MIFSEIDRRLVMVWKETLGHIDVTPITSFMSVGGDDILFSVLGRKISQEFQMDCSEIVGKKFYYYYQQANFLKIALKESEEKLIVNVSVGSHDTGLVLVHPIGGGLFGYANLIKLLKTKMPIIGLQDASMCGIIHYYYTLEEQAKKYVFALNENTDLKSIILLGHSYGANLAFEIAKQLKQRKIEVKHLIIVDGWAKQPYDLSFKDNFKKIILRQIERLNLASFVNDEEVKKRWFDLLWHRACLLLKYNPEKIDVPGTVIAAKETLAEYSVKKESIQSWADHLLSVEIHYVLGSHENIIDFERAHNVAYIVNKILKHFDGD